jgi:hypothetical protein
MDTVTQSDLITIAEVLKFIRTESPDVELDVLELIDLSDDAWEEILVRLNNSIKD